jgi:hypothetical protein
MVLLWADHLKALGLLYFVSEVVVILLLVVIEYKVYSKAL